MRTIEQRKLISDLKDYVSKMDRADRYEFEMFQKRDKDDEELDDRSYARLEGMHKRYVVKKTKADIDALLKKYASQSKKGTDQQ
ncbi:MAG: hypothetical protein FJ217_10435 [Ignavibacteria bacterium]|nr:hypothetical protein [Ignavibacteria bacterium]